MSVNWLRFSSPTLIFSLYWLLDIVNQTLHTCLARVSEYTGRWYEYASTPTDYSQGNDNSCVRALYTDQGSSIGVFNEAVQ